MAQGRKGAKPSVADLPPELPAEELRRICDSEGFDFETTAELPALQEVLGQPRAVAALEFGTSIASHGFNLFALGQPGSGKMALIRDYLVRRAATGSPPPDLCYVNNFGDAHRPVALRLPAGRASQLKRDVGALLVELREAIPKAFESEEYRQQRDQVVDSLEAHRKAEFARVEERVTEWGFRLVKASAGLVLAPALEGKLLSEAEVQKLSPEQREKLTQVRERLEKDVEASLLRVRELERGTRDALRALDRETATFATRHLIDDLRARYQNLDDVLSYLDALQADVIGNADEFRADQSEEPKSTLPLPFAAPEDGTLSRYEVNVVVDNGGLEGAPVVIETNPTYHNLIGRVEHKAQWGALTTNHTMIKPGALHRANGGFLVVPARECLLNAFAWEGLKRALKDRAVRIEELGAQLSLVSTVTLKPEPVPLDVKVVLIGSPLLYYLLNAHDEDFQKLFKVKADFTTRMPRNSENERAYGLFVSTITQMDKALPFDRGAVAQIVEYGSRMVGDHDKLSTRFGEIADLVREAAHCAARNSHAVVAADDVRAAIAARRFRQNLLEEDLQEAIARGIRLIETEGSAIGRINGLSVLSLGDYAFGHPTRITAAIGPGRRGVVSIEREVELSGPIHGKGVLILGGYLARTYGFKDPINLSASLVFEQSYGMVEGDSASLAELFTLLSALAEVPLRQDIAVTGSVNQHGSVQPVGGLGEKIEGFFDVCQERGLTGSQGVLIPAANRKHLMLREDVVEAARAGRFHVWTAEHVDEAVPLLMGTAAGKLGKRGAFPKGTLHRAVADRLSNFTAILRAQSDEGRATGGRAAARS